jgi:hypothetical protein
MFAAVRMKFCPSRLISTNINAKTRTQIIICLFFFVWVRNFVSRIWQEDFGLECSITGCRGIHLDLKIRSIQETFKEV